MLYGYISHVSMEFLPTFQVGDLDPDAAPASARFSSTVPLQASLFCDGKHATKQCQAQAMPNHQKVSHSICLRFACDLKRQCLAFQLNGKLWSLQILWSEFPWISKWMQLSEVGMLKTSSAWSSRDLSTEDNLEAGRYYRLCIDADGTTSPQLPGDTGVTATQLKCICKS